MTSSTQTHAPAQLPAELKDSWNEIVLSTRPAAEFRPELTDGLPPAAQRWLRLAIEAGTPLRRAVELDLHGVIKLKGWRSYTARQVLSVDRGYIWTEQTRVLGLPVTGFDRLIDGVGEMRHWTFGHLPVVTATGADVTLSAAGRFAAELTYLPSLALDDSVTWTERNMHTAVATVSVLGHRHVLTLTVSPTGEPQRVSLERYAQVPGGAYRMRQFVADLSRVRRFDGYAIPTRVRAGYADDGGQVEPFIEQVVDRARFH